MSAPNQTSATPGRWLVPFTAAPSRPASWPSRQAVVLALLFGLTAGAGGAGAYAMRHLLSRPGPNDAAAQATASAVMLHQLRDEVARLQASVTSLRTASDAVRSEDTLRGVKRTIDTLKQDMEQARSGRSATLAQLSTKIDRLDRDPGPKLAEIAARLDRIERAAASRPEPVLPKAADPAARLDRPDKTASVPLTTGSIPPVARPVPPAAKQTVAAVAPDVTTVPAAAKAIVEPRPPVSGWVLREVYDGIALVQARNGGLREVEPGEFLPGAGEVRSIERRGRGWVVLTSRGVIATAAN